MNREKGSFDPDLEFHTESDNILPEEKEDKIPFVLKRASRRTFLKFVAVIMANSLANRASLEKALADGGVDSAFNFKLGIMDLYEALGDKASEIMGWPLENEHFDPVNGNAVQRTTTGLAVWRKEDNWTAFTNGSRTWINRPEGVQERGNKERFEWETDSQNNGSSFDNKANQQDNELYLEKYRVVNALEQTVDGKRYTIQTLVSPTASHSVIINPTAEENLRKFIAEEGKRNGFHSVRIIVLGQDEEVEGVWMGWEGYRVGSKYERIGFYGSQRLGVDVNLFYGTDPTSPFDNPYFMQNGVRATLGARFVTASVTGGSLVTNSMSPLGPPPTPEQWTRILGAAGWSREAFDLIPYSSK